MHVKVVITATLMLIPHQNPMPDSRAEAAGDAVNAILDLYAGFYGMLSGESQGKITLKRVSIMV